MRHRAHAGRRAAAVSVKKHKVKVKVRLPAAGGERDPVQADTGGLTLSSNH